MKDHSRRSQTRDHLAAADAVLAEVTAAVRIADRIEETTGIRGEMEFIERPKRTPPSAWDRFEHGLTWFLIGAFLASFWYLALIRLYGWM